MDSGKSRIGENPNANRVSGTCLHGKRRTNTTIVGEWNQDVFFALSLWYRIATSTDGKPVA